MVGKLAELVIILCLGCLVFALACVVMGFILSTPIGIVAAPIVCVLLVRWGVNLIKNSEGL